MAQFCDSPGNGALGQGELLSEVQQYVIANTPETDGEDGFTVNVITHPYVMILSQACDLDWEYRAAVALRNNSVTGEKAEEYESRRLAGILMCAVSTASEMRYIGSGIINSKIWDRIKINKDERYHFLESVDANLDASGEGLPELTMDFKKYFTIPPDDLYHQLENGLCRRRVRLISPYLEHLSHRFSAYMSRIGLPEDYKSMPEQR